MKEEVDESLCIWPLPQEQTDAPFRILATKSNISKYIPQDFTRRILLWNSKLYCCICEKFIFVEKKFEKSKFLNAVKFYYISLIECVKLNGLINICLWLVTGNSIKNLIIYTFWIIQGSNRTHWENSLFGWNKHIFDIWPKRRIFLNPTNLFFKQFVLF